MSPRDLAGSYCSGTLRGIGSRSLYVVLPARAPAGELQWARVPLRVSAERFGMAGARRRLRYPVRVSGLNGPVTVRFMTPSRPGWSLEEAVDLVRQGYTVAHASRVSGWAPGLIETQVG